MALVWGSLSGTVLRTVYDANGGEKLAAVWSTDRRAEYVRWRYSARNGEQLDYLSNTGQLTGGFSTPIDDAFWKGKRFPDCKTAVHDASLRSAEEPA